MMPGFGSQYTARLPVHSCCMLASVQACVLMLVLKLSHMSRVPLPETLICPSVLQFMSKVPFPGGLAQCGAFACFDEFNRLELEVLSVVAQQLLALQAALRSGAEEYSCLRGGTYRL